MTLQEIRYFCVTAEVLHYTKAANLLYISQPSLSYALSKLEKELGVHLFEKRGKQVSLTKYGEAFLPYAKRALNELSDGIDRINSIDQPETGIVSLGYINSTSFTVLPEFVNKFYSNQKIQQIAFRFQQGMAAELIERLLSGDLDLLIAGVTGKPDIDAIDYLPIYSNALYLVVPENHPLTSRLSVDLSDLAGENFISIRHESVIYHQLESKFKKADVTPHTVYEADEYSSIAASVATGAGVAIMPRLPMLSSFNIRIIPFKDASMKQEVSIMRNNKREMTSAIRSVWEFAESLSTSIKEKQTTDVACT